MGALAALGSAALWALTNLLLRGQVQKLGGGTANAWRTVSSTLFFLPLFLFLRQPSDLLAIPTRTLVVLLTSVLLSMVIGDIRRSVGWGSPWRCRSRRATRSSPC